MAMTHPQLYKLSKVVTTTVLKLNTFFLKGLVERWVSNVVRYILRTEYILKELLYKNAWGGIVLKYPRIGKPIRLTR